MRSLVFEGRTWEAYEAMRQKDKKLHNAARKVIKELIRCDDPTVGLGKPEPLQHNLSGFWSRRLSQKDRIVYEFDASSIYIFALGGHYDQP
ncbi:Txe/YoeB family addiction module toxin [Alloalcanivorax xenomutans]|uniref:Txe/YoeB family addiction module toxin n=1 Tax=Alloalcanivorax xenomutans TaxID=1094342 RepID=UPI00293465D2|nr:Txe/YoeB family addiction module toxin [Alloalcanivorax xenomutans]WOD29599.1 Txe/YoeB family addiction module toxin [Alloalcanivorax xenomutans]